MQELQEAQRTRCCKSYYVYFDNPVTTVNAEHDGAQSRSAGLKHFVASLPAARGWPGLTPRRHGEGYLLVVGQSDAACVELALE
jgi:hypothetical protein